MGLSSTIQINLKSKSSMRSFPIYLVGGGGNYPNFKSKSSMKSFHFYLMGGGGGEDNQNTTWEYNMLAIL